MSSISNSQKLSCYASDKLLSLAALVEVIVRLLPEGYQKAEVTLQNGHFWPRLNTYDMRLCPDALLLTQMTTFLT